jgi:hypothetical protein
LIKEFEARDENLPEVCQDDVIGSCVKEDKVRVGTVSDVVNQLLKQELQHLRKVLRKLYLTFR